jgi:hypothetical protein
VSVSNPVVSKRSSFRPVSPRTTNAHPSRQVGCLRQNLYDFRPGTGNINLGSITLKMSGLTRSLRAPGGKFPRMRYGFCCPGGGDRVSPLVSRQSGGEGSTGDPTGVIAAEEDEWAGSTLGSVRADHCLGHFGDRGEPAAPLFAWCGGSSHGGGPGGRRSVRRGGPTGGRSGPHRREQTPPQLGVNLGPRLVRNFVSPSHEAQTSAM